MAHGRFTVLNGLRRRPRPTRRWHWRALVNAPEGSAGLSLFLLELRTADGHWNGIEVRRLKDKRGTHALPTAELDLVGAIAHAVGKLGRGTAELGGLLNIARLWAPLGGPAGDGYLLDLARDYARRRYAFSSLLCYNAVHQRWRGSLPNMNRWSR